MEERNASFGTCIGLDRSCCAPVVFLSLEGKIREAALELDIATLRADDGMEKLYERLDMYHFRVSLYDIQVVRAIAMMD